MNTINSEIVINYNDNLINNISILNLDNNSLIEDINKKLNIFVELYNLGFEKLDNIYNDKYTILDNSYKEKINNLSNFYDNKILTLKNDYKQEYDIISQNNIKILELQYAGQLELERYKNKEKEREIEELKTQYNNSLSNIHNILEVLNKEKTNIEKGIIGEAIVYNYLYDKIKINHEWSIENVSKDGNNSSDIEIKYKNLNCVIEVKNIKTNMVEGNMKKFNEVYINNDIKKYNCGLFISLKSDFGPSTNLHDFSIKVINNKYVIYLANTESNLEKIIIALDVLNYMLSLNENYNEINIIMELLSNQMKNYNTIVGDINKASSALKSSLTNIKKYKEDIYKFLERKKSNSVNINNMFEIIDNKFQCVICSKSYTTKIKVIEHIELKH
jgi:ABC-type transporter MlaC component